MSEHRWYEQDGYSHPQNTQQGSASPAQGENTYTAPQDNMYTSRQENPYTHQQAAAGQGAPDGNRPYTSRYDTYRFRTPDMSPAYKGMEKPVKKTSRKKVFGIVAGIIAAVALIVGLGAAGIHSLSAAATVKKDVQQEESLEGFGETSKGIASGEKKSDGGSAGSEGSSGTAVFGKQDSGSSAKSENSKAVEASLNETGSEYEIVDVVDMCLPSMVAITNTGIENYYNIFGESSQQKSVSAGSGIIVGQTDSEYLIATNEHVVSNSEEITVTFDDDSVASGTIKGTDSVNDLAIISVKTEDISEETKNHISVIAIGDSDSVRVGEEVVAIGNALGYGQTVSHGIISAKDRTVVVDGVEHTLLQTDASINPGNSGGALLNMRGELIGINEIKIVDTMIEGVGYAIPMSTAEEILIRLGTMVPREKASEENAAYMGVVMANVQPYLSNYGFPKGIIITEVVEGGPADEAGLKANDFITAFDGQAVTSVESMVELLSYYEAGESVDLSVSRMNGEGNGFEKLTLTITLGRKADSDLANGSSEEGGEQGRPEAQEPDAGSNEGGDEERNWTEDDLFDWLFPHSDGRD